MADYFIDHGAYGSELIGAAAPSTFGVPQEGDGSSKDASTAASVASATFNAVPTSGSFTMCGITISNTGVINAASTSAAATALANNINAVTTLVSSSVAIGTPALKNLVYALASGNECQIMMRVGSSALNQANNSNVSVSHSFNASVDTVQFAGGVGGCFGWFINDVVLGGTSATYTYGSYGVASTTSLFVMGSSSSPDTQAFPTASDTIWLRSNTGVTIRLPLGTYSIRMTATTYDQIIVLDSNTKWTSDSGTGIFTVIHTPSSGAVGPTLGVAGKIKSLSAITKDAFQLLVASNATNHMAINCASASNSIYPTLLENVLIAEETDSQTMSWRFLNSGGYQNALYKNCTFQTQSPRTDFISGGLFLASLGSIVMEDCNFIFNHNTAVTPSPLFNISFSTTRNNLVCFRRCTFSNISNSAWTGGKYTLLKSGQTAFTTTEVIVEDCTGLALDDYLNISSVNVVDNPNLCGYYYRSAEAGNVMRLERWNGYVEWGNNISDPVLNALLPDQSTRWSMKMSWVNTPAGVISPANPFRTPKMVQFFRGASTDRTITFEVLTKDSQLMSANNAAITVGYISDVDGTLNTITTRNIPSAYSASSAAWTNTPTGYTAKKFTVTVPNAIMTNTEVIVTFALYTVSPTGSPEVFYFDPQPTITT